MINVETIRKIVDDTENTFGKIFALSIQFLIIVSLVTFTIDTLPDLSTNTKKLLRSIEVFTIAIFTIEYILRIIIAENKAKFIFSFYGLVDLLAILPFYISSGLDLRSIRVFRLLRLTRILKLFRYNQAIKRFHRALVIAREELILFGFVAIIMLYLSAFGIYYFESEAQPDQFKSVIHSLWWAVTTLTTVGYGDMFPVTAGGKFFTFLVQHRNPCPLGKVRVQWLCHLNDPFVISKTELSQQHSQGETNESIQETITNNMVLPVSYCLGSQIPISGPYRQSCGRS